MRDVDASVRPLAGSAARSAIEALAGELEGSVRPRASLASFTAMRVGGPAELLVVAESAGDLTGAVAAARRHGVPWRVLGGGCNVLIADRGLRGLVIVNRASSISIDGCTVWAESGAMLATVARRTLDAGLAGLAWASGLPGTVGGAVVGNAGAFEGDIAGTLRSATVLEPSGEALERDSGWFGFEYRHSRLKRQTDRPRVVLSVVFELEPGEEGALRARAEEVLRSRQTRHPSGATMGSTFKNPPGSYAGQLIEDAGLKGYSIGGARVSEHHANFLINEGDATAEDVLTLIQHVQAEVKRRLGVGLVLEIELLGWE